MPQDETQNPALQRLSRLLNYLETDPANERLLADAIATALDAGALDVAAKLLDDRAKAGPLTPQFINFRGLIALRQGAFDTAAELFSQILDSGDPAVRFNLAWCRAMAQDYAGAVELIDDSVTEAAPRSATLKLHALQKLEAYDEALIFGQAMAERHPEDQELMGAMAMLALDLERVDLAQSYVAHAGNTPDGLTSQGTLLLNDAKPVEAMTAFDRAIAVAPRNPRAWLGKGLCLLNSPQRDEAAACLDLSAELFGDHLGSWIAAGWAHFSLGDRAACRTRFEKALALDDTFAETHGSLAVLDVLDGDIEAAKRRIDVARRLDRQSMSTVLAQSLLMEREGDPERAQQVIQGALDRPIDQSGRTLAQAMAALTNGRR